MTGRTYTDFSCCSLDCVGGLLHLLVQQVSHLLSLDVLDLGHELLCVCHDALDQHLDPVVLLPALLCLLQEAQESSTLLTGAATRRRQLCKETESQPLIEKA